MKLGGFAQKRLHLLTIMAITSLFGILTSIGASATVGDTFVHYNIEGFPITYKITSETFQTVEIVDIEDFNRKNMYKVTLPNTVENKSNQLEYSVTSIGGNAFYNCTNLINVVIPDSIITIGDNVFYNCTNLKNVVIPDNVITIGDNSFNNCESLSRIILTSFYPPDLGDNAFKDCYSNFQIYTPIQTKDDYIAAGYPEDHLKDNLFIANTIENIPLIYTVDIALKAAEVSKFPLHSYTGSVTIPETITYGKNKFTITSIGYRAFENCDLTTVSISDSVINIGYEAFFHCKSLVDVEFGSNSSLESIDRWAFDSCENINKLTIPSSVKNIDGYAFAYCTSLTKIITDSESPAVLGNNVFYGFYPNLKIYLLQGNKDDYISAGWPEEFICDQLSISGRVNFSDGTTHEGIEITLYDADNNVIDTTTTDVNGNYTLFTENVKGGEYTVNATGYYFSPKQKLTILPLENKTCVNFKVSPIFIPVFPQ